MVVMYNKLFCIDIHYIAKFILTAYVATMYVYLVHTCMLCYSEIVVDPSYEELKICDGTTYIISNRPQLNTINIEGNL